MRKPACSGQHRAVPRARAGLVALAALLALFASRPLCAQGTPSRVPLWRFVTGGRISGKPALDHRGLLYLASEDRFLYCLGPDGGERWRAPLGSRPTTAPVVTYEGVILVGTASGRLLAFGPAGRERWSFPATGGRCVTPALGRDGSIFLPTGQGSLYCLTWTGQERWRFRTGVELEAPPAVGPDGTVYLPTGDRRLLAITPTGAKRWELSLPGDTSGPAIAPDGSLYVGASGIHRISAEGTLQWSFPIPARTSAPVLTDDGTIVAGGWNRRLYAVSPKGRKLWELRLPDAVASGPASAGELLYVPTASPLVYAVGVDGSLRWSFAAKQAVGVPAVGRDGSLYVGGEDWILYSLGVPSQVSGEAGWPVYLHDYQNTGRSGALENLDSPAALILETLAASDSTELKMMALDDIDRYVSGERYLGIHVQTLEEILALLSSEGVTIRERERGAVQNSRPEVRVAACAVLGGLATEGARSQLLSVLRNDPELAVRISAVDALGRLGLDPDGELAAVLTNVAPRGSDQALVRAGVEALGRIVLDPHGAVNPECVLALARFRLPEYPSEVRTRAAVFLEEFGRKRH
jgi:outer membrane protein assembly factor BamB